VRFLVADIRNAGRVHQTESYSDPQVILGKSPEYTTFRHPLEVEATADMAEADIVVSGRTSLTVGFSCARCLEDFERTFKSEFSQVYTSDQNEIDLTSEIKEAIYIDMPLTPVCRESCKGLCPVCGVNKNQVVCQCQPAQKKSSWDALKEFRFH
jgi:uncharacterized protein